MESFRELRYAAPFFGGTPFGLGGRSLPAPLPGCAHNQACVAALVRIAESTPPTFSAVQLRFLVAAVVTLTPEFIEALASKIVGEDENNQQTADDVLLSTIAYLPDDKLAGFAIRLGFHDHRHSRIPGEGEVDSLAAAQAGFAALRSEKVRKSKKAKTIPSKVCPKTNVAKKSAAA